MTKKVENKIYLIYKFTNKINGKSYIGFTCRGFELRKYEHFYLSNKKSNFKFHLALKKYGTDNFSYEILENNIESLSTANNREMFYIEHFNTYKNGYNMTIGGGGREDYSISEHTREKMRKSKLGTKQSDETKLKHSLSLKGIPKSETHRINASKGRIGVKLSENICKEMSERMIGRFPGSKNPAAIKVNIYDNDGILKYECNGNFESLCNEFKLPLHALRKSYYNNGEPIYTYKNMKRDILSRYGKYIGWYAIKL